MEIKLAKTAGFCFGVERAVNSVYELLKEGEKLYTYGPIIHNDTVVNDLKEKGVTVIESREELLSLDEGTVVIRAHGVPECITDIINEKGLKCVDNTCPFVKRIHDIVKQKSGEGYNIVVIGNAAHPEVIGIIDRAKGNNTEPPVVVENEEEARSFKLSKEIPLCIVSQTTFRENKFKELVEIIENRGYNVNVVNTVCNATSKRQREAKDIASGVDAMLVIGGRNSSNTQKLYDICKNECPDTRFIETVDDLRFDIPMNASMVGITAGASTPKKIIEEVQNYVRINF